jgi:hypothetical protein
MGQVSDMILAQFAGNFAAAAAALPATATSGASAQAHPSAASAKARELNALALLWGLIKGWFAGVFGKRAS